MEFSRLEYWRGLPFPSLLRRQTSKACPLTRRAHRELCMISEFPPNQGRCTFKRKCFVLYLKHKGKNRPSLCVFPALWHSPQSRSCRNSAGLLELCFLYRVEHSRPGTQNRLSMQNTALWGTCKPAARETFQFSSSVYSRCVPSILGSQLPLFILFGISIILAKSSGHWGTS